MALRMKTRDAIMLLRKDGWVLVSVKGSHAKFAKGGAIIIIPNYGHGNRTENMNLQAPILKPLAKKYGLTQYA